MLAVVLVVCSTALMTLATLRTSAAYAAPPVVSDVVISPGQLPAAGGSVTVSATLQSEAGIRSADVTVYLADGGITGAAMTGPAPGTDTWSATVAIPANGGDDPVNHNVEINVVAQDDDSRLELVGSIDVAGQPPNDPPAFVYDSQVTPGVLPAVGGSIEITASATDNRSVSEVYAEVTTTGGGSTVVALDPIGGERYVGSLVLPANLTARAVRHRVAITALDDIGQPGVEVAGTVRVSRSTITPSVTWIDAGSVEVGGSARCHLGLRNHAPLGSAPSTVRLRIARPEAPFVFDGTGGRSLTVVLAPQERTIIRFRLAPTTTGRQKGRIVVAPIGPDQPRQVVLLTGTGTTP